NALHGVFIENGSTNNSIGTNDPTAFNTISGNTLNGIYVFGASSSGNQIVNNRIGLNGAGDAALPNGGNGILVQDAAGTLIGSTSAPANFISNNNLNGISITGASSAGTVVTNTWVGTNVAG